MLKKIPGSYDISCLISDPKMEFKNWLEYFDLKRRFGGKKKHTGERRGKLLIISLMGNLTSVAKMEILLAKSADFAGLEPVVLTNRWSWANRFYRAFGIKSFVYFDDFLAEARKHVNHAEVEKASHHIKTFDELMGYSFNGVNTGKYICSSLVRKTYSGVVEMDDPETQKKIREYLVETSINTMAALKIYEKHNPDAVLFLERGYTPYGEFFDVALNNKLNVVQWCGSHKSNSIILKRYNKNNQDQHPASLSPKTWNHLEELKWDAQKSKAIKEELFKNYASGEWFSDVGTQVRVKMSGADEVKKELGLDLSKKTAIVFSHLFWDATFFWGEDIFTNYREWFVETVRAACKNDKLNWVLKLHPANVVKLNRDGYKGELVEKQSIRESIGKLPPHIKVLEPSTKISTYSLFKVMDYCVT
ncbi:MAG: hypothetical protein AAB606_04530, partial [Patescibacteria group bacterium]